VTDGRPRRILLVTNWIDMGGAEMQVAHLALGLRRSGHSVTLLAIGGIVSDVAALREAGVEVAALEAGDRWAKLRALPRLVGYARRAELVHCTGWDATLWGRVAAAISRRPALITEHTGGRANQVTDSGASRARLIKLHNRLLDRWTGAAIVVGAWQRELLLGEGVSPESIVWIPNAVPVEELRERAGDGPTREQLGIPASAPLLIEVARFVPQKRQGEALRTVAALRERFGDVRVLFAGAGVTERDVEHDAEELGADWATFLGERDDVPALLRLADVAVLPSAGEGLPLSLIEAIVLGVPVVGTDVGDVSWLIHSTRAGICVPASDGDAFTEACAELLGDPELRRRLAAAGTAAAPAFDAPLMVERYERVFEAIAKGEMLPTP
jgi:glycosyltransferase involved in cell wall biosynthesis